MNEDIGWSLKILRGYSVTNSPIWCPVPVSRNWYKNVSKLYKNSHIRNMADGIMWPDTERPLVEFWSCDIRRNNYIIIYYIRCPALSFQGIRLRPFITFLGTSATCDLGYPNFQICSIFKLWHGFIQLLETSDGTINGCDQLLNIFRLKFNELFANVTQISIYSFLFGIMRAFDNLQFLYF